MSKKRRADGSVRPCRRRYRLRRRGVPYVDPAVEEMFRRNVIDGTIVWGGLQLSQQAGVDRETLSRALELLAERARWVKLRDSVGVVRAIGMPRNHPKRSTRRRSEHRELMRRLAVEVAMRGGFDA